MTAPISSSVPAASARPLALPRATHEPPPSEAPAVDRAERATSNPIADELSAARSPFARLAAAQGFDPKELADLRAFAERSGTSLDKLAKVGANASYQTPDQKMMAMRSYAVADDAVRNGKLSEASRRDFAEHVLPNLENGAIHMAKGQLGPNVAAKYDSDTNTYYDREIDLSSVGDRATTLHELQHAVQDAKKLTSTRLASEREAHDVAAEYVLRETGVLARVPGGTRIDGGKLADASRASPGEDERYKKIIADYAIANAAAGRHDLNAFKLDGIDMRDVKSEAEVSRLCADPASPQGWKMDCAVIADSEIGPHLAEQRRVAELQSDGNWSRANMFANLGKAEFEPNKILVRDGISP